MAITTARKIGERFFADIADGNDDGVLDAMSPSVVFDLPASEANAVIPAIGVHRGKDEVAEALRLRAEHTDVREFELRDLFVDGNTIFAVVFTRARHRRTDIEFSTEAAQRLTLGDDDKIVHWIVYVDSAREVAAFSAGLDEQLFTAVDMADRTRVSQLLRYGANPTTATRSPV